ncbi:hypothetical protein HYC85_019539 [Camellia sinensis]|uniref:Uncharacterized protein n=1 Tax=Camellia sinensis TaxID=4442 RepID=A0A7J7GN25_CAMSI|nr:hypothetical protein HYC85_019539 [Camellia sinensis]
MMMVMPRPEVLLSTLRMEVEITAALFMFTLTPLTTRLMDLPPHYSHTIRMPLILSDTVSYLR